MQVITSKHVADIVAHIAERTGLPAEQQSSILLELLKKHQATPAYQSGKMTETSHDLDGNTVIIVTPKSRLRTSIGGYNDIWCEVSGAWVI